MRAPTFTLLHLASPRLSDSKNVIFESARLLNLTANMKGYRVNGLRPRSWRLGRAPGRGDLDTAVGSTPCVSPVYQS